MTDTNLNNLLLRVEGSECMNREALREAALRTSIVCNAGHLLAGENVIVRKNGRRRCAECERRYQREWRRRKRALLRSLQENPNVR